MIRQYGLSGEDLPGSTADVRGREGVQLTIGPQAWLDSSYAGAFTVDQLVDGGSCYRRVVGVLQSPLTVTEGRPVRPSGGSWGVSGLRQKVDRRGMKNHVAWVHRGVVPAWRKAKRR